MYLFQYTKLLLVHMGYYLNRKKSFLHVHCHIFWTNCHKRDVEFLVSQNKVYFSRVQGFDFLKMPFRTVWSGLVVSTEALIPRG